MFTLLDHLQIKLVLYMNCSINVSNYYYLLFINHILKMWHSASGFCRTTGMDLLSGAQVRMNVSNQLMASYHPFQTMDSDTCSHNPEVGVPSSLSSTYPSTPQNKDLFTWEGEEKISYTGSWRSFWIFTNYKGNYILVMS